MMIAAEYSKRKKQLSTDELLAKFESVLPTTEKPKERIFRPGVIAKYKNNTVTYSLKDVSKETIEEIEKILERNV